MNYLYTVRLPSTLPSPGPECHIAGTGTRAESETLSCVVEPQIEAHAAHVATTLCIATSSAGVRVFAPKSTVSAVALKAFHGLPPTVTAARRPASATGARSRSRTPPGGAVAASAYVEGSVTFAVTLKAWAPSAPSTASVARSV